MQFINSYSTLDTRLYHKQIPTPLKNPKPGHFNPLVAERIGWDAESDLMQNWVDILAGEYVPEGFEPLAMAYAGHQFGQWAGQLGDGRGLLMGQVIDKNGELTDLHLKGVGLTPYSRMGDGRAVLRSTIREYLCGHAMNRLGIRSSNALGFITSETSVRRETIENGAALMRVADTHIRLGHIEWIASFAPDILPNFTKYMIETYYPELATAENPVLDFIEAVIKNTATMIADWQLIGFAHGVMNTDNLSITGSTIDYGPFGFMERFNPAWINNHSDYTGRYAYQNQPAIGHWNLNVCMQHMLQLNGKKLFDKTVAISKDELSKRLASYETTFMSHYQQGICRKLGLSWEMLNNININDETSDSHDINATSKTCDSDEADETVALINKTLTLAFKFLEIVENNKLDYTNSFRSLIAVLDSQNYDHETSILDNINEELSDNSQQLAEWQQWQTNYKQHIQNLIEQQTNSIGEQKYKLTIENVIETLKSSNPIYVLRNAMAQKAITKAESGDLTEVDRLFNLLKSPYDYQSIAIDDDITPPAKDAKPIVISCSS